MQSYTFVMLLFQLGITYAFIHHSSSKFVKKRPKNGKGPIMISIHDEADLNNYNKNRLLMMFDLDCIDLQLNETYNENIYEFGKDELAIEETHLLEDDIGFILETYPDTCSQLQFSKDKYNIKNTTFHIENQRVSFVFFKYKENSNIVIDYDELCIDYITYEPLYTLQQHTCNTIDISKNEQDKKYGLDLITSVNHQQNYSYPDTTNSNVDLYILDSGISSTHPEFQDNTITHVFGEGDINGHGTHVAGIAAGKQYGISKKLNIFSYQVCTLDGGATCSAADILNALDDITNKLQNTDRRGVINLSLGGLGDSQMNDIYDTYFANIIKSGGIPVVAAGNDNDDSCNYVPSGCDNTITVGSYDKNRHKSPFSNYGTCVDIFAPGSFIYSSYFENGGDLYAFLSGTSMAAPFISGVVANLLTVNNDLTFETVKKILLNGASIIIDGGCDDSFECYGAVYNCSQVWSNYNTEWNPVVRADSSVYESKSSNIDNKWIIIVGMLVLIL